MQVSPRNGANSRLHRRSKDEISAGNGIPVGTNFFVIIPEIVLLRSLCRCVTEGINGLEQINKCRL